ncbi:nucleotidyltransferase substrate binding protein [Methanospirillum stamsii]|uniref:Nucleotidyltransferase n=1 Tax=Methanospirillum stamsii TaxID=1277351 RepID=A0A2V2N4Y5_9EURY|nr:nucleotidyltransferase substrate binding protein [Methanospirillum stamsii]PWR70323.1 nucleotidyltransferase [Methanospirillum stamsii]
MAKDIRYIQRLANYQKALIILKEGVDLYSTRPLSNMEKQGLIKSFEFTYELSWNLLRDYSLYQGYQEIRGSRDAIRQAIAMDLIFDGETWMNMIESRNSTAHTYDEKTANDILEKIVTEYYPILLKLEIKMKGIADAG